MNLSASLGTQLPVDDRLQQLLSPDDALNVATASVSATQLPSGPPEIAIEDIRLEAQIGEGSFGRVYRGTCRNVPCAVKMLHATHVDDETLSALRHEIDIMRRVVHPNTLLFLGECVAAHQHEILTSRGFLTLDAVLATVKRDVFGHVVDWYGLKVANYDPVNQCLVYDEPRQLVIKTASPASMVVFEAESDDDNDVRISVTRNHDMYVRMEGDSVVFAKVRARDVTMPADLLTGAANGVTVEPSCVSPLLLELYGVWIACHCSVFQGKLSFPHLTPPQRSFLIGRFQQYGVSNWQVENDDEVVVSESLWPLSTTIDEWIWSLGLADVRHVVRGMLFGSESLRGAVVVYRLELRDALVRLFLHGGLSASCAMMDDVSTIRWRVVFDDKLCARVSLAKATAPRGVVDRRVWCLSMPSRDSIGGGFVVVRQFERRQHMRCSRPMIVGNCTSRPPQYMIVTELMQQSVESLLFGDNAVQMSLVMRLRLARDAALGMLWLHGSKPMIIHRDLKLSNLLVDQFMNCKVADFGLSQFKPFGEQFYLQDLGAGQGTIWTLAPEVMRSEPFNHLADVYSFGVCLWELVTLGEPYAEFQFVRELIEAVAMRHVRPVIPDETNSRLSQLMTACWAPAARDRPDFAVVLGGLEQASIEIAIDDAVGRMLWAARYASVVAVTPVDTFLTQLLAVLRWPAPTPQSPRELLVGVQCVRLLLTDEQQRVTSDRFGSFCAFFGPLKAPWAVSSPGGDLELLNRVLTLCSRNWYHGEIASAECVRRLAGRASGTFLVRNSGTSRGAFAISKMTPQGIVHLRVTRSADSLVVQAPNVSFASANVVSLIESHASDLGLLFACPGSSFVELFENQQLNVEGYVN